MTIDPPPNILETTAKPISRMCQQGSVDRHLRRPALADERVRKITPCMASRRSFLPRSPNARTSAASSTSTFHAVGDAPSQEASSSD